MNPRIVKAGSESILCSKASNQEEDSKCVSGVEKMSYEVCVCRCVYNCRAEKCVTVAKILIRAQARNDGEKNWVQLQAHDPVWCL